MLLTPPPLTSGARIRIRHILAMAKAENGIRMLLDIDHILEEDHLQGRLVAAPHAARAA